MHEIILTSIHRSPNDTTPSTVLSNHIAAYINVADDLSQQQRMPVRREAIWKNIVCCLSKPTFVYNCGLNVVFVGEGVVDCRGPLQ